MPREAAAHCHRKLMTMIFSIYFCRFVPRTDINRLDVLGHALTNRRLSGRQGRALLRQFSFDSDRLKALSLIAPCLEGSDDRDLLLDTFTFSGYVSSARQLLDAQRR